ncbi:hypothetical protein [Myceligenerans pegani]|uniref:Uncharacterized protein n=1 Tax=Myceligenerans pegani TaxID=2776917 RepID=A0ABR9N4C0_9MICO|nr:hypothetical protein [Myceligenerans sp. TRM 65318]MBE1878517.1 hypothetical protein [Myceligenerans sp. TRM 65318]MBE3020788.1 hypothetical protein [Myceligenerans sp. TRM 65318]
MGTFRFVAAALAAGATTAWARGRLESAVRSGELKRLHEKVATPEAWTRTNHRGEPISLLEGPAVAAGLVAGAIAAGGSAAGPTAFATAAAGAFGVIDDVAEDTGTAAKGLRGHLGALTRGQVTTGGLKVLGIGTSALAAAAAGTPRGGGTLGRTADVVINGALIAGTANLVNLFDLRPGRALKAATVASLAAAVAAGAGTPGTQATPGVSAVTGALLGAAAVAAPGDLGERDMLGDGGANALGALVGAQLAFGAPRAVRLAALAGVVGLTLASERVSFSRVIRSTPWLHRIDMLGRRPVPESLQAGNAAAAPSTRGGTSPGATSPADENSGATP